jgi:hypothetical protein
MLAGREVYAEVAAKLAKARAVDVRVSALWHRGLGPAELTGRQARVGAMIPFAVECIGGLKSRREPRSAGREASALLALLPPGLDRARGNVGGDSRDGDGCGRNHKRTAENDSRHALGPHLAVIAAVLEVARLWEQLLQVPASPILLILVAAVLWERERERGRKRKGNGQYETRWQKKNKT